MAALGPVAPGRREGPVPGGSPPAPRRLFPGAPCLLAALLLLSAATTDATAQEGDPGAEPDTVPAAEPAPGDTIPAAADTTEEEPPPPAFPRRLAPVDSMAVGEVHEWGREELIDSSALSLLDFLLDRAPGVLPLRSGFHVGPHHLADGVLGPGNLQVVVDGRELPPLEATQPDLARLSLSHVDRVRLVRRAGETVVSVETASHPGGEAYSRITGGTGQPNADLIRGVFTNGAGDHFTVAGALDHLNAGGGPMPGERLDAWAKLSWMPAGNEAGVELLWRSESLDRTAVRREEFDRRALLLHARGELAPGLQADVWLGRSSRDPAPGLMDDGGPGLGEEGDTLPSLDVPHAEAEVTFLRPRLVVQGEVGLRDEAGMEKLRARGLVGFRLTSGLQADAAVRLMKWSDFTTSDVTGGITYRPPIFGDPVLRLEAATGSRGVPRPGGVADSISYDALAASARVRLGPYTFSERFTYRSLSRHLPFGGEFDAALAPGEGVPVTAWETAGEGPLIPLSPLAERLRVRGFFRYTSVDGPGRPVYLPRTLGRGELVFRDRYFDGNLRVKGALRLVDRSALPTAAPGEVQPTSIPAETAVNSSLVIRIDSFRIWWRVDNLQRRRQFDFGGLVLPLNRNVVGITWEFFD